MKKTIVFSVLAVLLVGAFATGALAFGKNRLNDNEFREFRGQNSERHAQMLEIKEKLNDAMNEGYEEWVEVMETLDHKPRMFDMVNEENFETFVEMHNARVAKDFETMNSLRGELGLEDFGMHKGQGRHYNCVN